ncbi:MAG: DsrE/DsrF/DrsH-like family protein [Sterolibacterium sp.]|jgi:peroxiredoxin family protein|nr:DsrE/DsrF/DrsH-like family protein [Sterolibacterium sp.]
MEDTALEALIRQRVDERLAELLPQKIEAALAGQSPRAIRAPSLAIIASKGTLDWAYPPFILASTAAALGWEARIFFTFYGLGLLQKDLQGLQISPLGNPAMPMKMPFGPDWLQRCSWNIPNVLQVGLPGFEALATRLMQQTLRNKGVASIVELRALAQEAGVVYTACQMTVDLFGYSVQDFIEGVDFAGAASFLPAAQQADVTLFV